MMVTSDFRPEVELWPFRACAVKNMQYNPYLWKNCQKFYILQEIGSRNAILTSDFIETVQSLGRYHVPQNVFLVITFIIIFRLHHMYGTDVA